MFIFVLETLPRVTMLQSHYRATRVAATLPAVAERGAEGATMAVRCNHHN